MKFLDANECGEFSDKSSLNSLKFAGKQIWNEGNNQLLIQN